MLEFPGDHSLDLQPAEDQKAFKAVLETQMRRGGPEPQTLLRGIALKLES